MDDPIVCTSASIYKKYEVYYVTVCYFDDVYKIKGLNIPILSQGSCLCSPEYVIDIEVGVGRRNCQLQSLSISGNNLNLIQHISSTASLIPIVAS